MESIPGIKIIRAIMTILNHKFVNRPGFSGAGRAIYPDLFLQQIEEMDLDHLDGFQGLGDQPQKIWVDSNGLEALALLVRIARV